MTKCSNPKFHQEKCLEAKQRLIKTVRLRLPSVAHLIPTLDLKIILLHRDPRGVMNSRWSKAVGDWCCKYIFMYVETMWWRVYKFWASLFRKHLSR